MIAFDLDGVFVSDLVHTPDDLDIVLAVRNTNIRPVFRVTLPYYIITGRPECDREDTLRWIEAVFAPDERPRKVFHDNPDFTNPVDYKVKILAENSEITTFVESDAEQVVALRKRVSRCRILTFEELLRPMLEGIEP